MDSENYGLDLINAEAVQKIAENRAQRWVKAWGNNQGEYAYDIKIDWASKKIMFRHRYSDGVGFGFVKSINLDYLTNDANLEKDSKEWKVKHDADRMAKFNRIRELEVHPVTIELVKLRNEMNGFSIAPFNYFY